KQKSVWGDLLDRRNWLDRPSPSKRGMVGTDRNRASVTIRHRLDLINQCFGGSESESFGRLATSRGLAPNLRAGRYLDRSLHWIALLST
ncbi:MAG: hypothetical protein AAFX06_32395, partial [Planctomycetota bacterium]